jgi:NAD-dependent dihydropyrimidine dehydrogenase PreA subunit
MFDPYEVCPQSRFKGAHSFVAGMMVVHQEDVIYVASRRKIECERCEKAVGPNDVK